MKQPKPELDLVERHDANQKAAREKRAYARLVEQLKEAQERQLFLDKCTKALARTPTIYRREKASGMRNCTAVALASDWHVEEPVVAEAVAGVNEYNLAVADKRIKRFFDGIVWSILHHRASKKLSVRDLVLALMGDLITGYIHIELVESNLLSPVEAVDWLIPRLVSGIKYLLDVLDLESITIPCSHGNHGRTTEKSRISTGAMNSFEWLMYRMLANSFQSEKRVRFHITQSAHQYVEVYGQTLHFHHGDSLKYLGGVGGIGIPFRKAMNAWDGVRKAAVHHIGHFHNYNDFGNGVTNGSLIGFGGYSQWIRAAYEVPQQAFYLFDSERGKCQVTPIWVTEGRHKKNA